VDCVPALVKESAVGLNHTVKQGEHLSGIAFKYGFFDYHTIWNHPHNAELKRKRQNPNVLFPGDQLYIPDKQLKMNSGSTGQRHRFKRLTKPLLLQIKLEKGYNEVLANTPCDLFVELDRLPLTTDPNGMIQHEIPKTAASARLLIQDTLKIHDKEVPFETELAIKIGHLDPVEEASGQRARLANLGYYRSLLDTAEDQVELQSAIEEFQCEHGLVVDGKCGALTQAKLKQVHGC
jgi:putative peptidoglycan binding protein/LysM domain-containing protein